MCRRTVFSSQQRAIRIQMQMIFLKQSNICRQMLCIKKILLAVKQPHHQKSVQEKSDNLEANLKHSFRRRGIAQRARPQLYPTNPLLSIKIIIILPYNICKLTLYSQRRGQTAAKNLKISRLCQNLFKKCFQTKANHK
jgi:hypothetical protein